ncbi:MAG: flippase [Candidatus Dormibacteraeota bacterium]|nr:flippase [Candidatus Dormibacteraeota bacterium]MBV9525540.1 flippase [Candidatus Dormibacteraeota bacterium]
MSVSGRRLAGHIGWNILGQAAPIVVALVSIPVLTRGLGPDRFGLLVLGWTFVGYFSIFDLGLAVAMERSVARQVALGEQERVHTTVWTTLLVMFGLGAAGFAVAWLVAPVLVHSLRASPGLQSEALTTVHLLACSIPLVIVSVGLRGVLAAHMRFRLINAIGIPLGAWTYAGPLLALPLTHSLVVMVAALLAGRIAGFCVYAAFCVSIVPSLRRPSIDRSVVRPLLTFGGWLALDDLIDPLMGFLDRFLIGALVSVAAVAFYSVPFQLAAQGWIIASALSGVLFPLLSGMLAGGVERARVIFRRTVKYLLLGMFPGVLLLVAFAQPGLQLWLGGDYAARSAGVLQLIAAGVLITSLGSVGGTFNGGAGRPDVNAKLGLVKFALHVAPLWWVLPRFGIVGLAALWLACVSFEAAGMLVVAMRSQGVRWTHIARRAGQFGAVLVVLGVAALDLPLAWKGVYVAAVIAAGGVVAWTRVIGPAERRIVRRRLGFMPVAASGS